MRRNAGQYLREKIQDRVVMGGGSVVCGLAWLFGAALPTLGAPWWLAGVGGAVLVAWGIANLRRGWRRDHMKKGARAEERAGYAIERALMRGDCAVAHNVTDPEIAANGDIDHLIATPGRIWVVETKAGRIPPAQFPERLERIAANVKRVRTWSGQVAKVEGVLVFAGDRSERARAHVDSHGERIRCFPDTDALTRALRDQAGGGPAQSGVLAGRIWQLGGAE